MPSKREEIIEATRGIIAEYAGIRLNLRGIHYRLFETLKVTRGIGFYPNTISSYKWLSDLLARARESDEIPWDAIEDQTRGIEAGYGEERSAGSSFRGVLNYFQRMDSYYEIPKWWGQKSIALVILEKAALQALFSQVTQPEGIDLVPLRGYSSVTLLKEVVDSMERFDGREIVGLYFGDWDPSGENIQEVVERKLREYGMRFTLERVAITEAQIEEYDIPPAPAKTTDSRYAEFEARHGEAIQVELDAIEPRTLQRLIREAIRSYWDRVQGARRDRELADRRGRIRAWVQDAIDPDFEPPGEE